MTSGCKLAFVGTTLAAMVLLCTSEPGTYMKTSIPFPPEDWVGWKYKWRDDRYNMMLSWAQFHAIKNFTEKGFEIKPTPPEVYAKLKSVFDAHIQNEGLGHEGDSNIVSAQENRPYWIENGHMNNEILQELKPLHEAWGGTPLIPTAAYGFRVYRDGNVLKKHVDRVETHIISSIVHVGRDVDEPWPIVILDNEGNENAVDIKPGQMLHYESAKLMHWREGKMKGKYYSSVFIHYKPADWPVKTSDIVKLFPPGWDRDTTHNKKFASLGVEPPEHDDL
eukprot:m.7423 g.7423  ORF g.7423 m.7423 type:complete len:278 (+) comp3712_c0_seq1:105-938(+)